MFLEASALTGENVEEAFLQCAKTILSKVETGNVNPKFCVTIIKINFCYCF
jgi:Ras-related protein Rab-4B